MDCSAVYVTSLKIAVDVNPTIIAAHGIYPKVGVINIIAAKSENLMAVGNVMISVVARICFLISMI